MKYTHRYMARIILEAETPLFVGSGREDLLRDALVEKDHHGLPIIRGTSLIGVLRHSLEDKIEIRIKEEENPERKRELQKALDAWGEIFGFQIEKEGKGSQLRISSAYLLLPDGTVAEGLEAPPADVVKHFDQLPLRQHVRINHRGAGADKGLFSNEVIYKGCRFKFELELRGDGSETEAWKKLLRQLGHPLFRIGQGTRNGYGKLKAESCLHRIFNLEDNHQDFDDYLNFDPSLNKSPEGFQEFNCEISEELQHYRLVLEPDDSFFIFGSGYADAKADQTPVMEEVLEYHNDKIGPVNQHYIPASSIKGAIRHRTCFHYNRLNEIFADKIDFRDFEKYTGIKNHAVHCLFGHQAEDKESGQRGRLIFNDVYYRDFKEKLFNHVAIDRFTGGAFDGALFSEKVNYNAGIEIDIWLEDFEAKDKALIIEAFEAALQDICNGLLPLGGMTTKGHGFFKGQFNIIHPKTPAHV